ncbi:MAG: chorismate-binding protein, partial [Firmicutes bacterium]|nr:chorismate-binding protein [Bacillota bacterium]
MAGGLVQALARAGATPDLVNWRSAGYNELRATLQAGAGIVLESDPLEEYRECLNKAKAALAALGAGES